MSVGDPYSRFIMIYIVVSSAYLLGLLRRRGSSSICLPPETKTVGIITQVL